MARIGIGGLVCSIIGLGLSIAALFFMLFMMMGVNALLLILMTVIQYGGLGLGTIGLILGIVGTVKDEGRAPGIVGIVLGSIAIAVSLMMMGLFFLPAMG